jgi:hypothetical protein
VSARSLVQLGATGDHVIAKAKAPRWDYRKWGTLADPIHKSHMSTLLGEFACTKQFSLDRMRELEHVERETCSGKTEMGTAIHEAIARALRNAALCESILAGRPATSRERIRQVIATEFERATADRTVSWYGKADYAESLDDGAEMIWGLFSDMHLHVESVELVEAGFIVQLGELWLEGHTDAIYRPRGYAAGTLAFTDWKSGAQKPHQLRLDHGYESGFYAHALAEGLFIPTTVLDQWRQSVASTEPGTLAAVLSEDCPLDIVDRTALAAAHDERSAMHVALRAVARRMTQGLGLPDGVRTFNQFPEVIRLTQLRDYVPYEKKGTKAVTRPEDLEYWSRKFNREIKPGEKITYEKGDYRGGAWLEVRRNKNDVTRLERMLRAVVGWVRFGKFVEAVGEKCTRCPYKGPCLTSGYEVAGEEAKSLNDALKGLDLALTDALDAD